MEKIKELGSSLFDAQDDAVAISTFLKEYKGHRQLV